MHLQLPVASWSFIDLHFDRCIVQCRSPAKRHHVLLDLPSYPDEEPVRPSSNMTSASPNELWGVYMTALLTELRQWTPPLETGVLAADRVHPHPPGTRSAVPYTRPIRAGDGCRHGRYGSRQP